MGFTPRALKKLVDFIPGLFSAIYQRSWKSGDIPNDWNLANFIPICKKTFREDPENYQPINLTSVPGKVEEIILGDSENQLKNKSIVSMYWFWLG